MSAARKSHLGWLQRLIRVYLILIGGEGCQRRCDKPISSRLRSSGVLVVCCAREMQWAQSPKRPKRKKRTKKEAVRSKKERGERKNVEARKEMLVRAFLWVFRLRTNANVRETIPLAIKPIARTAANKKKPLIFASSLFLVRVLLCGAKLVAFGALANEKHKFRCSVHLNLGARRSMQLFVRFPCCREAFRTCWIFIHFRFLSFPFSNCVRVYRLLCWINKFQPIVLHLCFRRCIENSLFLDKRQYWSRLN